MNNLQEYRHILVIEDQKSRRIVSLKENTYSIGRDPSSSILIYDRQVSRHHATLLRINTNQEKHYSYRIIDGNLQGKKSTNGLIVNGKHCQSHDLKHGDTIRFGGKAKLNYHILSKALEVDIFKENNQAEKSNVFSLEPVQNEEESNTIVFNKPPEANPQETLTRLSSLAEFSPNPIIEINFEGKITYLNPSASFKFEDIREAQQEHPLLKGLLTQAQNKDGTSFIREINLEQGIFEQHVHYLVESQLIRSYLFDITKRKQLEAKLALSQARYNLLCQQTSEGVVLVDAATKRIVEANSAYCHLLGYALEEIIELTIYDVTALDPEIIEHELEQISSEKLDFTSESLHRCRQGALISVETKIRLAEYDGKPVFCFSVRDIGERQAALRERKRTEEVLQYQSSHDRLTNLPNQTLLKQQLSTALANAKKHQHLMAVLFLDLDSFRNINHTLGHVLGDRLLQNFAQRLSSCVRPGDIVARWGSDEFAILLPRIQSTEDTVKLSQKILDALKESFEIDKQQLSLKSSIGIAIYPQDGEDTKTLLKNADTALCSTKEQGRNHYQFYNPNLTSEASRMLKIETLLHQALERGEFSLEYQPQFKLEIGAISGMEALLRWHHPEFGAISPLKFLPLAEKTDLIVHIGKWVLQTACAQNRAWQEAGFPAMPIAVNLSTRQFQQGNLVEIIAQVLEETRLAPPWLELEVTETTILQDVSLAQKTLQNLQAIGVRTALEDFGTGYSSLGNLKHLPLHTLKIAQSSIRDLRGNPQDLAMISAILTMGSGFKWRVIAEGVETQQQLDLLQSLNCEQVQGYYLSHPLKVEEATQFLSKRLTLQCS